MDDGKGEKSPAQQLVEIGYDAVPQLIAVTEDERFTRSFRCNPHMYLMRFQLRVGDYALDILRRIAGRSFLPPRSTATITPKAMVQAWWQEFQKKGERRMLIEGTEAGDYDSSTQAKYLAAKYPADALAAIREGARRSREECIREWLVEVAATLPGEEPVAFLREELHGPVPAARVAAARGLVDRGRDEAVTAMIREWTCSAGNEVRDDLITFLLCCGKVEAVKALARDLRKQPVDVRFRVIAEVHSGPWGWKKQKQVLPREVHQAIDTLLVDELDDTTERTGSAGSFGEITFSDPRLCDLSGRVLALRWQQPDWFDHSGTLQTRDRQRRELKEVWRTKRSKEPMPLP
jgi:hypothetical protein